MHIALMLLGMLSAAASEPDWEAVTDEVTALLSGYLQTDTTNPPGNEAAGALYLSRVLAAEGIDAQILDSSPGRSNLVARLPSSGEEAPLCLLSHIDVVPWEAESWDHPPDSGAVIDGEVWGRGALDMKGMGALELEVMLLLARHRVPLRRDVVLLAVADEEDGGEGARFIASRWDEIGCSHVINEGGLGLRGAIFDDQTLFVISVGEKGVLWTRMVAEGEPGHGSIPQPDSAPRRLRHALEALEARKEKPTYHPALLELLAAAGEQQGGLTRFVLARPWLAKPAVRGKFMAEMTTRAAVTDTVNVTGFGGAGKPNVVPGEAWVNIDARLLPGTSPADMLAELEKLVDGHEVRFDVISEQAAAVSEWHGDPVYEAIATRAVQGREDAVAGPAISVGFTDSIYLRPLGVRAYGFVPFELTLDEAETMHGNNERVSVDNLATGVRMLYDIVTEIAAGGDTWHSPVEPELPEGSVEQFRALRARPGLLARLCELDADLDAHFREAPTATTAERVQAIAAAEGLIVEATPADDALVRAERGRRIEAVRDLGRQVVSAAPLGWCDSARNGPLAEVVDLWFDGESWCDTTEEETSVP